MPAHGQPGPGTGQPHPSPSSGKRRRDRSPERRVPDGRLAWSVVFFIAAVVGALAAADIVHERPVIAVFLGVLIALLPATFLLEGRLKSDSTPGPGTDPGGRPPSEEHQRHDEPEQTRPPSTTTPSTLPLPTSAPSTSAPYAPEPSAHAPAEVVAPAGWWEQGQGAARSAAQEPGLRADGPPPHPAVVAPYQPEPRDLSRALIAQCPNCGSFQLNAAERGHEWRLGCLECAYEWTWRKGDPAPSVQVRPEVRRKQGR